MASRHAGCDLDLVQNTRCHCLVEPDRIYVDQDKLTSTVGNGERRGV